MRKWRFRKKIKHTQDPTALALHWGDRHIDLFGCKACFPSNTHMCMCAHEHTQAHRHTDTHRDTHTHTDTDTHRHTQTHTQTHTHTDTHRHTHRHTHTDTHTDIHTQTHTQTHTHTDTHRHTHRHTHTHSCHICSSGCREGKEILSAFCLHLSCFLSSGSFVPSWSPGWGLHWAANLPSPPLPPTRAPTQPRRHWRNHSPLPPCRVPLKWACHLTSTNSSYKSQTPFPPGALGSPVVQGRH